MLYNKIILAGGNGYIGTVLANYYREKAQQIIILSRTPKADDGNIKTLVWDGQTEGDWINEIDGADLLINLCGKNVNCRYTPANREAIIDSRVLPTTLLGNAIAKLKNPPQLWINVTSATIYRHAEDRPQDEETGEIGTGFSIDVCRQWEDTFFKAPTPRTRKVALRMSIVMGAADGAFPRLLNLVKFGLGGMQGSGMQYVSWVHEHDAARCTEWLLQHPELNGVFNCTSPQPIKNKAFMADIRKAAHVILGLPAPAWLLQIGAVIIGTETELILKSRWVLPKKLTDSGFTFMFPDAETALNNILTTTKN
ncbi:TIGR01777 family oxidoreductase [Mucilaginibacter polytrichastri]|uniref:TIGR01777 family protein n=1 Tax=Mucilaginibacter polytrichastri TaxID=1302689 RepID=A0A1Q6A2Z0_9SPHI|nr:TIGR01777 family oxidoreductase [Mucilaginibacter polytrichastri]OKS88376.1 hypothetical protein RG47T_3842 [Mucilaginibacter polytrichastri]SFT14145.1 hypothetical protein SAMN04487890_112108 [Mucilaginibacter polytrichastri]